MNQVKLSILIPTYNYRIGIYKILECLNNINYAERENIEIIVSDDSDKVLIDKKLKNKLKKIFANFKYIHNKVPLGGPKNWNKLISLAKGKYIWLLHHDEFWEKNKNICEYILNTIDKQNPNIILLPITKQKIIIFKKIKFIFLSKHKVFHNIQEKLISEPKLLLKLNILGPPSAFIYKNRNLKYDTKLKYLVDVDFYIRLLKNYDYKNIFIGENYFNIISSQNNKNSITKLLKGNIKRTLKKEKKIIKNKHHYKFNLRENLYLFYSYLILKIFFITTTKIKFQKL